ncbi:MAG: hypothetical protein PHH09_01490 [Methanoregulaceae archaeon]|jgi:hypothetical protein|nr:hypothetical protein [Methanoregulaceae archaeon]MDD5047584.1 hypothetical protein [Methanoregulaceae archaeon]
MKVKELIEMLQKLPPDAEILRWDTDWHRSLIIENVVEERGSFVIV